MRGNEAILPKSLPFVSGAAILSPCPPASRDREKNPRGPQTKKTAAFCRRFLNPSIRS